MDVKGYLVGAFPRPVSLIKSFREHTKGAKTVTELDFEIREAVKEVIRLQRDNNLYYIVDGQLVWEDLFRPIAMCLTNVLINGLSRWFDNNFFYKKPVFTTSNPTLQNMLEEKYFFPGTPPDPRMKAIFPEPYTMAAMSESDNPSKLAYALAESIGELCKGLRGISQLQLSAPYLAYKKLSTDEIETSKQCVGIIRRKVGCELMLHFPFGRASNVFPHALDFKVDVLGFDMYKTPLRDLENYDFGRVTLYLGLLDGRNTLVEKLDELSSLVQKAVDLLDAGGVHVGPSCELSFLPFEQAVEKVHRLGQLVNALR